MYELKVVRDYRDGKISKEALDQCSTCDLAGQKDNGLSQKSNEALKDRSGEDIVAQDLEEQMKRERK